MFVTFLYSFDQNTYLGLKKKRVSICFKTNLLKFSSLFGPTLITLLLLGSLKTIKN